MKFWIKKFVEHILAWATRRVLNSKKPIIIGVTGSAGKTSTKEAIGHILRKTLVGRDVRIAKGNLNTELGLPLVILGIQKPEGWLAWMRVMIQAILRGLFDGSVNDKTIFVLEYGAEQPGDIAYLVKLVPPQIGVVTLVSNAHTQFLGSIDQVAQEKSHLIKSLPKRGLAVLNGQDSRVRAMAKLTQAKSVFVNARGIDLAPALAVAVAKYGFGIKIVQAHKALEDWHRPAGRLNLLEGIKGTWVIDDTYNSNPASVALALNELRRLGRKHHAKRLIAVLGDMLELGSEEYRVHKGVALAAQKICDVLILVGPRFRRTRISQWFPGPIQAREAILRELKKGDMILVKGSQSMRMEKVTEALLKNKSQASKVLVRQSKYWKSKPYVAP